LYKKARGHARERAETPAYAPQDQPLSERFGIDDRDDSVVSRQKPMTTYAPRLSPLPKGEGEADYDLLLVIEAVVIVVGITSWVAIGSAQVYEGLPMITSSSSPPALSLCQRLPEVALLFVTLAILLGCLRAGGPGLIVSGARCSMPAIGLLRAALL
jgi:hypothetical protein